ncbi:hypothetical protein ASPWEDRAFT_104285 [Aspergillus wentii DTO 134E9]|uniref:Uncharacterized protein n=1 Tax=Aspergillus wentii DTO 134E9 TaxID=1073089 RepID=A0A1L9RWL8_ASPWE|nr:uncharacterized protein ASPWEDRAFT_104285 [Aspergillus wentii DTO 134E9]KAI9928972.1 hypothetical protein MW887_001365 [Aspergillus wentii]OJJ39340.1 hypothetical protein ASPWEDRAFT_104285 [Aspergillus wentii DTO 134E9]
MTRDSQDFGRRSSEYQQRRLSHQFQKNAWTGPPSGTIYAGVSASFSGNAVTRIALAIRDTTYLLDFLERGDGDGGDRFTPSEMVEFILHQLKKFSEQHLEKFMGLAMPQSVADKCHGLCSRLWAELDIIPLTLPEETKKQGDEFSPSVGWETRDIDEQAESMGRKCVRLFGPDNLPLLQVGLLGQVEVDTGFHVRLTSLKDFHKTVSHKTWSAVNHYATDLKKRNVKLAFFSATPQGGGVALMRHSMVRFSHSLETDVRWYVPKPRPGIFRVTKNTHNILQGVSKPEERLSKEDRQLVMDWINENAKRYWLCPGGPLRPPSEGGADVVVIDDPQMPALIPIAKKLAPNRPIIFRSHIQIRSDLVSNSSSPQAEVWQWLWEYISQAELFISHPVSAFVPHNVPQDKVGYVPASTDWLDGLNKNMRDWDTAFYGRVFNGSCRNSGMPTIDWPEDEYIVQIARFDPSKGIPAVLESYEKFLNRLLTSSPDIKPPKLLICGHGSIDDPDGSIIYDNAVAHIEQDIPQLRENICVMRVRPSDQVLNALLSKAKIVLQLSTREGFEVKVSEAIHKGKPIIATRAGGIPLQIENHKNGFLVDVGDTDAVAQHLYDLWTNNELYHKMSSYAINSVSDEVSTVGNMLNWLYLTSKLSKGEKVTPHGSWINDMAREEAGQAYTSDENRLTRAVEVPRMG